MPYVLTRKQLLAKNGIGRIGSGTGTVFALALSCSMM